MTGAAASAPPLCEVAGLTRIYRLGDHEVRALDGVSLTLSRGELVAVMGSSGSGKSTLMNILGCLDRPTGGHYRLEGAEVSRLSAAARAVIRSRTLSFVFQSFHLLPRTTALENVELPLIYAGVARRQRRERAVEALRQVGLGSRMSHRPNELSGGQQQRVAVARALVTRPRLILADEPTGNLDSRTSVEIMALLQEVHAGGITVVLVTHEADVAAHAGRVITMKDGRVEADVLRPMRRAEPSAAPVAAP